MGLEPRPWGLNSRHLSCLYLEAEAPDPGVGRAGAPPFWVYRYHHLPVSEHGPPSVHVCLWAQISPSYEGLPYSPRTAT